MYLCPTGPLLEQIDKFYAESLDKFGFNAAHNYLPHVTLCSFFSAPDDAVPLLISGLEHAVEKMRLDLPSQINLVPCYRANQFIGLYLGDNDVFKRLANLFMRECSEFIPAGELGPMHVISTCFPWCSSYPSLHPRRIEVEPLIKGLHLTLAYQFADEHKASLSSLAESLVDPSSPCIWELRLFSRESRVKGCHVYRVLQPHTPTEPDELELIVDDFVYINPSDLRDGSDEWVNATSWLTGCSGQIPLSLTERTAESAAWTLHKSIALSTHTNGCHSPVVPPAVPNICPDDLDAPRVRSSIDSADSSKTLNDTTDKSSERHVVVIRHGERLDFCFGIGWIPVCFSKEGVYSKKDLNHPDSLPKRKDIRDFALDSPLTVLGTFQATLTGRGLRSSGMRFSQVYVSPSLRCIQTATAILKEMNLIHLPMNVEPGLFEFLAWYPPGKRPIFMTTEELIENGFNINPSYEPIYPLKELFSLPNETLTEYYDRSFDLCKQLLKATAGNILIIGHGSSLDSCTRQMVGQPPRDHGDFISLIRGTPYCGCIMIKEDKRKEGESDTVTWKITKPPILTLQHSMNQKYEWKSFKS